MKRIYKILIASCLVAVGGGAVGQNRPVPKVAFEADASPVHIDPRLMRSTNFNTSVNLSETSLALPVESSEGGTTATIVTVYETDQTDAVGLWQIGSGPNRSLWLNSQQVSYDNYPLTYRTSTEQGVVVHTMSYHFPNSKQVSTLDTLFLGYEGDLKGDKNICALYLYPGRLADDTQHQIESSLAIRYGALLHGSYVDSRNIVLWNTLGDDSLYSAGVCGIGRDDALSLSQTSSVVRGDMLTLHSARTLDDGEYVMMGTNGDDLALSTETIALGDRMCQPLSRRWKVRANSLQSRCEVRLTASMPSVADLRLLVECDGEFTLYQSISTDRPDFAQVTIPTGKDCYVSLVSVSASSDTSSESASGREIDSQLATFNFQVTPNPTHGRYTVKVDQSDEDVVNIRVLDANGRLVDEHISTGTQSNYSYEGSLTTEGIYYVTISSNGHQKTVKLIVVR